MAEIEKAYFLSDLPEEPPQKCSRIYFGAEFCFWRLPPANEIVAAREWAQQHNLAFTLVTPVLGETERQQFSHLLNNLLPALLPADEVLISDWGSLELVRRVRDDLEVILGRALSGQKRGPRITTMTLTPEQLEYFQSGQWYSREAARLLREQGIKRVELDNLLQGITALPESLCGSLHVPFAMVTSSRICPFRHASESGPCAMVCGEVFTLKTAETDHLLYQDGNSQFLINDVLPGNLQSLGVDRIVSSAS